MFEKGSGKPPGSGIKKGQKQKPRVDKESVAKILADLNINIVQFVDMELSQYGY